MGPFGHPASCPPPLAPSAHAPAREPCATVASPASTCAAVCVAGVSDPAHPRSRVVPCNTCDEDAHAATADDLRALGWRFTRHGWRCPACLAGAARADALAAGQGADSDERHAAQLRDLHAELARAREEAAQYERLASEQLSAVRAGQRLVSELRGDVAELTVVAEAARAYLVASTCFLVARDSVAGWTETERTGRVLVDALAALDAGHGTAPTTAPESAGE